MENISDHTTNDSNTFSIQDVQLPPDLVFVTVKDISNNTILPAPFYDELHFANYE